MKQTPGKYKIDRKQWAQLGFEEQMGNIYSEVGRSIKWYRIGDKTNYEGAYRRALDLFDATSEVLNPDSFRSREVLQARKQFIALFTSQSSTREDFDKLENYFFNYALAARADR